MYQDLNVYVVYNCICFLYVFKIYSQRIRRMFYNNITHLQKPVERLSHDKIIKRIILLILYS